MNHKKYKRTKIVFTPSSMCYLPIDDDLLEFSLTQRTGFIHFSEIIYAPSADAHMFARNQNAR